MMKATDTPPVAAVVPYNVSPERGVQGVIYLFGASAFSVKSHKPGATGIE
jgi:hypothetical protein